MVLTHFDRELFPAAAAIRAAPKSPDARRARKKLQVALISSVRLFAGRGWCLGFEYSLADCAWAALFAALPSMGRSEENTSELQSLMRISNAVFCLTTKTTT